MSLLDTAGVTWGWFQGGFAPTSTANGFAVCSSAHANIAGNPVADYVPHLNPFQYYGSTANPKHLPPSSAEAIGTTDQANHQYDLSDFSTALNAGNLPAVSFLEAPAYENGHAGSSDPLDEQHFLVNTINQIVQSPDWRSTMIVVTYDDSGGWYDHQPPTIVNGSDDTNEDTALCTGVAVTVGTPNDRCGHAGRVPLLVISPYAPANTVSHVPTDQTSILRFIEDNWLGGERIGNGSFDALAGSLDGTNGLLNFSATPHDDQLVLDPTTGQVMSDTSDDDLTLTNVPANTSRSTQSGPAGAVASYTPPTVVDEDQPLPPVTCTPASGTTFPIGTTTVTCTAVAPGDTNSPATATFTVTVNGAAEQLEVLGTAVTGAGPGKSLANTITDALHDVATGDRTGACSTLDGLLEVKAQSGKKLTKTQAASLAAAAARVEAVLAC